MKNRTTTNGKFKTGITVRLINLTVAVVFLITSTASGAPREKPANTSALQQKSETDNRELQLAYKASMIIELIQNNRPSSVEDIKLIAKILERNLPDVTYEVINGDVLIQIEKGEVILRFFDPSMLTSPPAGTVWLKARQFNRSLSMQVLRPEKPLKPPAPPSPPASKRGGKLILEILPMFTFISLCLYPNIIIPVYAGLALYYLGSKAFNFLIQASALFIVTGFIKSKYFITFARVFAHVAIPSLMFIITPDRTFLHLINSLSSKDKFVRLTACHLLGILKKEISVFPLIGMLGDRDDDVCYAAIDALVWIGPPSVEPLIRALNIGKNDVRGAAAFALGRIGDKRAVEPLAKALKDNKWHVRKDAAWALRKLNDPRTAAAIGKDEEIKTEQTLINKNKKKIASVIRYISKTDPLFKKIFLAEKYMKRLARVKDMNGVTKFARISARELKIYYGTIKKLGMPAGAASMATARLEHIEDSIKIPFEDRPISMKQEDLRDLFSRTIGISSFNPFRAFNADKHAPFLLGALTYLLLNYFKCFVDYLEYNFIQHLRKFLKLMTVPAIFTLDLMRGAVKGAYRAADYLVSLQDSLMDYTDEIFEFEYPVPAPVAQIEQTDEFPAQAADLAAVSGARWPLLRAFLQAIGLKGRILDTAQVTIEQTFWAGAGTAGILMGYHIYYTLSAIAIPFIFLHFIGLKEGRLTFVRPNLRDIFIVTAVNAVALAASANSTHLLNALTYAVGGPIHYLNMGSETLAGLESPLPPPKTPAELAEEKLMQRENRIRALTSFVEDNGNSMDQRAKAILDLKDIEAAAELKGFAANETLPSDLRAKALRALFFMGISTLEIFKELSPVLIRIVENNSLKTDLRKEALRALEKGMGHETLIPIINNGDIALEIREEAVDIVSKGGNNETIKKFAEDGALLPKLRLKIIQALISAKNDAILKELVPAFIEIIKNNALPAELRKEAIRGMTDTKAFETLGQLASALKEIAENDQLPSDLRGTAIAAIQSAGDNKTLKEISSFLLKRLVDLMIALGKGGIKTELSGLNADKDILKLILEKTGLRVEIDVNETASLNAAKNFIAAMGWDNRFVIVGYSEAISESEAKNNFPDFEIARFTGDKDHIKVFFRDSDKIQPVNEDSIAIPQSPFKYSMPEPMQEEKGTDIRKQLNVGDRKIIVAGHPSIDEIKTIISDYDGLFGHLLAQEKPLIIIVPRKSIESPLLLSTLFAKQGVKIRRDAKRPFEDMYRNNILVVNTPEELPSLYAAADLCIVGNDRNILEPASLGKAVLFCDGDWSNNKEAKDALEQNRGAIIFNKDTLAALLADTKYSETMGSAGKETIRLFRENLIPKAAADTAAVMLPEALLMALDGRGPLLPPALPPQPSAGEINNTTGSFKEVEGGV